jgi:hypothetical protein
MAGFALNPLTAALPEFNATIAHLRDVLGDQTYEWTNPEKCRHRSKQAENGD